MKRTMFNTLKTFSTFALLAATLFAQSGHKVIATVPFDFTVRNHQFAAGSYTVTSDLGQGTLLIRGDENGSAMFVLTHGGKTGKADRNGKLVFHRYQDRYFLSEVWPGGTTCARELHPSKAELELARTTRRPTTVSLLASGSHR